MGKYHGANVGQRIELCIVNAISEIVDFESTDLYRYDGRTVLKSESRTDSDRSRNTSIKRFKNTVLATQTD